MDVDLLSILLDELSSLQVRLIKVSGLTVVAGLKFKRASRSSCVIVSWTLYDLLTLFWCHISVNWLHVFRKMVPLIHGMSLGRVLLLLRGRVLLDDAFFRRPAFTWRAPRPLSPARHSIWRKLILYRPCRHSLWSNWPRTRLKPIPTHRRLSHMSFVLWLLLKERSCKVLPELKGCLVVQTEVRISHQWIVCIDNRRPSWLLVTSWVSPSIWRARSWFVLIVGCPLVLVQGLAWARVGAVVDGVHQTIQPTRFAPSLLI